MELSISQILIGLEQLHYEISTESRQVRVGLKDEQHIEPILKKYDWLASREVVDFLARELRNAPDEDSRERLGRLWFSCIGDYIYKTLAPLDDKLHTELSKAIVRFNGEQINYYNLQPRLQRESSFEKREVIGVALDAVHGQFNPLQLEMLKKNLALLTGELKFAHYIDYCQKKKQFEYGRFAESLRASLARTEALYRTHISRWCEERLARPFGTLNRYHVAHLMQMSEFDVHFPKERMLPQLMGTLRSLGIDLETMINIRLDLADRDKKNPRACCYAARVPGEVHLILKPIGGLTDYDTFLHEAGHALHYGNTDASSPYEYRKLGRSNALTEIYAFTFQNILMNLHWLQTVMGMDEATARRLRYYTILRDLYMFHRYCAKLLTELAFFQHGDWNDGGLYARTLTEATGFVYRDVNYLFDMDSEFYSADYLRAWIGEASLANHFEQQFGPRWAVNPDAGRFFLLLWRQGEKPSAEQIISFTGQKPLDLSCLENRFIEMETLL
ncbi:MAG: hypothetical protein EXS18_07430 [Verrucomicrobiae bacterium]|nr:hypothetical protein [Verrucomicrobiae bacterium]